MTWAATATYTAAEAIRAKKTNIIVNVFSIDWATTSAAKGATPGDYHRHDAMKANLEVPFGWYPQPVYFATIARRHMFEFGTTAAQLGSVAVTQRRHANGHSGAVMRNKILTLENYLEKPPLVAPLSNLRWRRRVCDDRRRARPRFSETACPRARRRRRRFQLWLLLESADAIHQYTAGIQRAGRFSDGGHRRCRC
jgi:acetyl-CoA acetyltransferase